MIKGYKFIVSEEEKIGNPWRPYILLDDPARAKLKIYRHILDIDPGEYPIHYFEKFTGYSHIKTANLLNVMNHEIQELEDGCRILNEKDKVVVGRDMPSYQKYQHNVQEELSY